MTNPDIPTDNSEQVALLPCLYDATPEQIERANAAVDANLINGVPRWGSAQGYACALTAIMQSDARLSTIPNVEVVAVELPDEALAELHAATRPLSMTGEMVEALSQWAEELNRGVAPRAVAAAMRRSIAAMQEQG